MIWIGCDVGTSSTKAVAVNEAGEMLAEASKGYGLIQPHDNWAEQEPDTWLDGAVSTIREVIARTQGEKVAGICISALYGGTGALVDEKLQSVRPALIWMDRRAEEESKKIRETIGEEKIFSVTNNGIDSYFGYVKLMWVKEHEPENWEKIRWVLPSNTYIVTKLTGQMVVDYSSAGNFGGVYDYHEHVWSKEMCDLLGFPFEIFPSEIRDGFTVAGELNEAYQQQLGLTYSVPVCTGTIDCIASMLSAAALGDGDNAAVLGTSLNWGIIHKGLMDDPQIISMPYVIDSKACSYSYGGSSTAGALPRWFVKQFCGSDSADTYRKIEEEVISRQVPPGSNGLIVLPYFMGERNPIWDENATGVFFGLTLSHTQADIYHAILESVAYSLLHIMESMKTEGRTTEKIVLVGGGARSMIWKQVFADVTGLPVYTPVNPVEAPLGDAFMAAYATGAAKDFEDIRPWIAFNEPVQPNMEAHEKYQAYFELYKKLYADLKEDMGQRAQLLK